MGFWRNVGYFWSGIMILGGIILFPLGLVSVGLGLFFIYLLKHSAREERMEKYLKRIASIDADEQERKDFREWREKKSRLEQE